ncbi:MAG: hypothetical protein RDV41_14555 [Planctomycetota bacterium]|nr:hypothetical protein [Planctomycetota bacterium]
MKKKILIVAGESSGDIHGAALVRALREEARDGTELDVFGMGGGSMKTAGVRILHDITSLAAVGLIESLASIGAFISTFRLMTAAARREKPDLAVLIDFPEFNLRFAQRLKELGIPVVYYISPQVWAWRPWRIKHIAKFVDLMLVFFGFEEKLYREHGVNVKWVGHPLLDHLAGGPDKVSARSRIGFEGAGTLIGLLPGSRSKTFERVFPVMAESARIIAGALNDTAFAIGCASEISGRSFRQFEQRYRFRTVAQRGWREPSRDDIVRPRGTTPEFAVLRGQTYDLMRAADLLIISSGTATLEAAIIGTPMVVTYKASPVSWLLTIPLINVSTYALTNIVAERRVVPELIQWRARPQLIADEVMRLFRNGGLKTMAAELNAVRARLGEPGAARRAAGYILEKL